MSTMVKFWLAKALVDVAVFLGVMALIGLVVGLLYLGIWAQDKRRGIRRLR